jgi:hypothetical protein
VVAQSKVTVRWYAACRKCRGIAPEPYTRASLLRLVRGSADLSKGAGLQEPNVASECTIRASKGRALRFAG